MGMLLVKGQCQKFRLINCQRLRGFFLSLFHRHQMVILCFGLMQIMAKDCWEIPSIWDWFSGVVIAQVSLLKVPYPQPERKLEPQLMDCFATLCSAEKVPDLLVLFLNGHLLTEHRIWNLQSLFTPTEKNLILIRNCAKWV